MLFSEVVGQKLIIEKLKYFSIQEKIPHALLFTGSEGVGKLSTALAFAQFINCEKPSAKDSCNVCPSCHKYSHLIHPDLHFVFPIYKGNKSYAICDDFIQEWRNFLLLSTYFKSSQWYEQVAEDKGQPIIYADEAIEIIKKLSIKNYEAKYKVIIVYQPEKMHIATANKLLKVLEEPPASTLFILISSQPELLLSTIVSRCQVVKFPIVDDISLKNFLKEKFPQYNEQDIIQSVLLANGSVPEAIQILEENENIKIYLDLYIRMARLAYEIKHKKTKTEDLIKWVYEVNQLSKENQKAFLVYSLRLTRDNFLINSNLKHIVSQTKEEEKFSEKFYNFMPYNNSFETYKILSNSLFHLERNGNSRIIFTDLIYQISNIF
jgi:DNA polymerase-3 subunit delta'